MSPRALINFSIFLAVLVLIDLYAWKGVNAALAGHSLTVRRMLRLVYWSISIGLLATLVWTMLGMQDLRARRDHSYVFSLAAVFLLFFLPKVVMVVFHGLDDLLHALRWVWMKATPASADGSGETLDRANFLSQLGLILSVVPFAGVLYGVTKGRRTFNVAQVPIRSPRLPAAFHGLRVVQISDMHLGSYGNDLSLVQNGVELINAAEPDLVLFTGDLVNDFADEAEPFVELLGSINARLGKYSILGNHDYSDYARWTDADAKAANLTKLKEVHARAGFRLMLDEHATIELNGERIGLLGVQNWGRRFQQYGDLAKTVRGSEALPFRILMSHDPTHWEEQVLGTGIDLTLSGHTHGAQFGVKLGGTTYSPAQWVYKHWAGHYTEGEQQLYVNRGFGFIGFPGRVGMPPEITVLELQRTTA
ncbi:MAG: metallophosphoesterase [Flavobacteriales bacterium]|nr:metallophosphoesterase [Flavobacteriales bacterium]